MRFIKFFLTAAVIFFTNAILAQDTLLTLESAIKITLENNYDVQIAENNSAKANNDNSAGNAGLLPQIDATGSYTRSNNSLQQRYNTGSEVNRKGANASSTIGDVGGDWIVFDGLRMFAAKNRLNQQSLLAREQFKLQIETSLQNLISAYYQIIRNLQLLKATQEEIKLSNERVVIAYRKVKNGSGSRLEWLQAKTEYNRQKTAEVTLSSAMDAAKIQLNQLMGRSPEIPFDVEDTVIIEYRPVFDELKKNVDDQNTLLKYNRINERISELMLNETRALRSPVISINGHYTYTKNTNDAGLTLFNRINGFNYGAAAVIPIFHGFTINNQIKNSKIDVANARLSYESANNQVNADLLNAWRDFQNNLLLLQMEEENIGYANEVLAVSQERYRVGVSNSIEQQEARQTFEEAMTRLADARYNAKISETSLRRLNGQLVQSY